jgi:hypothetical protein
MCKRPTHLISFVKTLGPLVAGVITLGAGDSQAIAGETVQPSIRVHVVSIRVMGSAGASFGPIIGATGIADSSKAGAAHNAGSKGSTFLPAITAVAHATSADNRAPEGSFTLSLVPAAKNMTPFSSDLTANPNGRLNPSNGGTSGRASGPVSPASPFNAKSRDYAIFSREHCEQKRGGNPGRQIRANCQRAYY